MSEIHDYETDFILASELDGTHVLVGESGGLSAVYGAAASNVTPDFIVVNTEHGTLHMHGDVKVEVLKDVLP